MCRSKPKDIFCVSGYCTKNYRKVERSVCQPDPNARQQFLRDGRRSGRRGRGRHGGTLAPLVTISLLIFACCCGVLCWRFKQQILNILGPFLEKNKSLSRRPSLSEQWDINFRKYITSQDSAGKLKKRHVIRDGGTTGNTPTKAGI